MIRLLLGFVIFAVWVVFARNYYVCEIKKECEPPLMDVDSSFLKNLPQTLDLTAGEYVILDNYPQFYFDYASHAYTYVDDSEHFLSLTAAFLKENSTENLTLVITGYYLESEQKLIKDGKLYNDLGIARAQTIVDKLIEEYNIPKANLKAMSSLASSNPITNPLAFNIEGYIPPLVIAETTEDTAFLEQIKKSVIDITYTDRSARFDYNSGAFNPHGSFDVYLDSLKSYFIMNPSDYLVVIGHTDSRGGEDYNYKLGMERAASVKKYLQKGGLEATIKIESKGEKSLLVQDQNSDKSYDVEAMAKNRRVNIIVKKTN